MGERKKNIEIEVGQVNNTIQEIYNCPFTNLNSPRKNAPITADIFQALLKHKNENITVEDALIIFDDCKKYC